MDFQLWLAFGAASLALLMIPGPTVLLVLSYALSQGRRVALATAAGVALGDFIAMSASLMGLGALVLTSALWFTVLKWIGAVYLIYLGIGLLRAAGTLTPQITGADQEARAGTVFRHAATVTALNPKSIVFFIAFVPQFIEPAQALLPQFSILIATFVGLAALNVLAYALLADLLRAQIRRPAITRGLARCGGAALICMGIAAAAMRRN